MRKFYPNEDLLARKLAFYACGGTERRPPYRSFQSAGDIVREIADEADVMLRRLAHCIGSFWPSSSHFACRLRRAALPFSFDRNPERALVRSNQPC
jgi:hypothetical protein